MNIVRFGRTSLVGYRLTSVALPQSDVRTPGMRIEASGRSAALRLRWPLLPDTQIESYESVQNLLSRPGGEVLRTVGPPEFKSSDPPAMPLDQFNQ